MLRVRAHVDARRVAVTETTDSARYKHTRDDDESAVRLTPELPAKTLATEECPRQRRGKKSVGECETERTTEGSATGRNAVRVMRVQAETR